MILCVHDIKGRKICKISDLKNLHSTLAKGIYIVKGKKFK